MTIKHFVGAVGLGLILAAPAVAADMPVKAPVMQPVTPAYNWSGAYVGFDLGGIWGRTNLSINNIGPDGEANMTPSGFMYGGHIGYRWQLPSRIVWGLEADIWGVAGNWDSQRNTDYPLGNRFKMTAGGSVRAQLGYAVDRVLFYGTGGVSVIHIEGCSTVLSESPECATGRDGPSRFSGNRVGWTAGAGIDYAFVPNWTARIEYLHADYGSAAYNTPFYIPPSLTRMKDLTTDAVRGGLSYKF